MKNESLFNGKITDLNQNKLWMQRAIDLICVNHPVNILSFFSKESPGISQYQTPQNVPFSLKYFHTPRNPKTAKIEDRK